MNRYGKPAQNDRELQDSMLESIGEKLALLKPRREPDRCKRCGRPKETAWLSPCPECAK